MRMHGYLWRGATPTVTERMHMPCRYLLAFDLIDQETRRAEQKRAEINGQP